jgi:hypothetical protein
VKHPALPFKGRVGVGTGLGRLLFIISFTIGDEEGFYDE